MRALFSYSFASWLAALIGFIAVPIGTRLFPQELLGQLNILLSIASILSIVALAGIDQGYIRYFFEEKESEGRKELLRCCLSLSLVFSAAA